MVMDNSEFKKTFGHDSNRSIAVNQIAEHLAARIRQHLDECTRCCPNCDHWMPGKELCELVMQRPPADVIAFGCERYDDAIPF